MKIDLVFSTFVSELEKRTRFLSEDNIRFYWFASMLKCDCNLNHYSLEEPYATSQKGSHKELDLMYKGTKERWCFEIKFNRQQNRDQAFALTDAAGSLFNDIIRLPSWKEADKNDVLSNVQKITSAVFALRSCCQEAVA